MTSWYNLFTANAPRRLGFKQTRQDDERDDEKPADPVNDRYDMNGTRNCQPVDHSADPGNGSRNTSKSACPSSPLRKAARSLALIDRAASENWLQLVLADQGQCPKWVDSVEKCSVTLDWLVT